MPQRVVVLEPNVVALETMPMPQAGHGQLLIETTHSLVSPGTERAFFMGLPNTNASYPLYPGYSNIGRVLALGEGVTGFCVGDRVASTAAHASHVVVDAQKCLPLPDDLDEAHAVFFNLIAIAMQAVRKTRIELGESVLVLGMGLIGLFALQLAKLNGGLPVAALDQDPKRLDVARACGADQTYTPSDTLAEELAAQGTRPQVVIEATGAPAPILQAFQLAAPRGRVALLGSARGETERVNFYRDIHRKGLTVIGAHEITRPQHESFPGWWTQRDEHRVALSLLAHQRLTIQPLITHRFTATDFAQAYDLLKAWDTQAMGMVITWT